MDIQNAIFQAKKAAGGNDFAAAQKILKKVITQEPRNLEAWLTLADIVQKPEVAEKCLKQVLKIDPRNQVALQKLNMQQPASTHSEIREGETAPAPQCLDDRLQTFAQPALESNNPWQVPSKTSLPLSKASPGTLKQATASHERRSTRTQPGKPKKSGRWLEFSLIGVLFLMAVCVLGLFLFLPNNTSGEAEEPAPESASSSDDPVAVIFANIRASNSESILHYMATIHSKSPSYQSTKAMIEQAFGLFDLSYRISGVKVTKQTKNETVVAFTLTTKKIRGPDFRDNRITGDMILRKEDGKWKIYSQVVHDITYLN